MLFWNINHIITSHSHLCLLVPHTACSGNALSFYNGDHPPISVFGSIFWFSVSSYPMDWLSNGVIKINSLNNLSKDVQEIHRRIWDRTLIKFGLVILISSSPRPHDETLCCSTKSPTTQLYAIPNSMHPRPSLLTVPVCEITLCCCWFWRSPIC